MTSEYAQIHTCILRDPNINGLPAESGWNWMRLIVLAKTNHDRGRVSTVTELRHRRGLPVVYIASKPRVWRHELVEWLKTQPRDGAS